MKNANDYKGLTDSDILEAAVKNADNGIVYIPKRKQESEPERDWWLIDRAILLPENTTVILQNAKIKLSDKCRDNFFRTANCGLGIENIEKTSNIHIKGEGLCVLEGADHPRATGDGGKILACPCPKSEEDVLKYGAWISDEKRESGVLDFWDLHDYSYGTDTGKEGESQKGDWRGIGILFANAENFSISNLKMVNTHGWAISVEACSKGRIEKIEFDMDMSRDIDGMIHNSENQDGIDIRNGCFDIVMSDITGGTGDDVIALTAIASNMEETKKSGSLCTTHVMHNDWSKRERDIHDITIRNVTAYCKSKICNVVRLLPACAKIYNVVIDGIIDNSPELYDNGATLLIGDADFYGHVAKEDLFNITISNVICYSSLALNVAGYLKDSVITNIINKNPDCPAIRLSKKDSFNNVLTSNIVTPNGREIELIEW